MLTRHYPYLRMSEAPCGPKMVANCEEASVAAIQGLVLYPLEDSDGTRAARLNS